MNIFQLGKEHMDIMALLDEMEGEVTPEIQKRWDDMMIAGEEKIKAMYWIHKHMSGQLTIIEAEEKRIQALKKSQANKIERLKTTMNEFMKFIKLDNIKDGTINIVMAKHTEFEYDESRAPEGYFETIQTTKFKLTEFKAWCKENQQAAAELCGAKFIEGKRIQIK